MLSEPAIKHWLLHAQAKDKALRAELDCLRGELELLLNVGSPCARERSEVEHQENWLEYAQGMPLLDFSLLPAGVQVKLLPPFYRALARASFKLGENEVSLYYDAHSALGYMPRSIKGLEKGYWEIFPNIHGDAERFPLAETEALMKAIAMSLTMEVNQ